MRVPRCSLRRRNLDENPHRSPTIHPLVPFHRLGFSRPGKDPRFGSKLCDRVDCVRTSLFHVQSFTSLSLGLEGSRETWPRGYRWLIAKEPRERERERKRDWQLLYGNWQAMSGNNTWFRSIRVRSIDERGRWQPWPPSCRSFPRSSVFLASREEPRSNLERRESSKNAVD